MDKNRGQHKHPTCTTASPVSSKRLYICPTICDDDCDATCHEAHEVPWKRQHNVEGCINGFN